jgi:hypothetical protein
MEPTTRVRVTLLAVGLLALGTSAAALAAPAKPVGWKPLSSSAAAKRVERSAWEPRPENRTENHTIPGRAELATWRARSDMPYAHLVDGRFTGTTDEIIQWAARKWGFRVDALRAVAALESWWDMDVLGDEGDSFGIFQVRRPYHCRGACAIARDSTAFNADYYGGIVRAYYDGKMGWLNSPDVTAENGARYESGDFWASAGAWFDGRWHTPADERYVARARHYLRARVWEQPRFVEYDD